MYRLTIITAVIILFLITGVLLLSGGGSKPKKASTSTSQPAVKVLPDYANTDATVSLTIDGRINGDESHRAIRVTIGRDSRQVDVIQGYSGTVIQTTPFYNTEDSYNVFLHSIYYSGFTAKRKGASATLSDTGVCAFGFRYTLALQQDGQTLSSLWTSSCGLTVGNLAVSPGNIQALFDAQIPNYGNLVGNVAL